MSRTLINFCLDALPLNAFETTLRHHESALPVIAAVEHHQKATRGEARHRLGGVARLQWQPKPDDIDGRAEFLVQRLERPDRRGISGGDKR